MSPILCCCFYYFNFKMNELRRLYEICGCIYNEYLTRRRAQYGNKTTVLYIYIMLLMLILNVIIFVLLLYYFFVYKLLYKSLFFIRKLIHN